MIKDLSRKKFGKLTVISYAGKGKWNCLCDCGKESIVYGANLKTKNTRSCGCLNTHCKYIDETIVAKKSLYQVYKKTAEKRNLKFDIDFNRFIEITQQNCFYCGLRPTQFRKYYQKKFLYNGLDRLDSRQGYIEGNIVACCKICNRMKWSRTKDEFFQWIKNIHNKFFRIQN